jgi:hypothetical protein
MSNLKTDFMTYTRRFTAIMSANYERLNRIQKAKEFISLIYQLHIINLVKWLTL